MKFLGWMHRKSRQNSEEPMKNSTIGNPSACFAVQTLLDEQNYCVKPTKTFSCSNIKCQKSSNRFEASQVEAFFQEESHEPFDFLAIGTFGIEIPDTNPPTPTFPLSIENLTNQQTDITESDLNLINYKLEKFLEADENETANDTSRRSSQASIITLINKPTDGADPEGHMLMVDCPLQNYLFANSIELAETDEEVKKEKTSLEELFKINKIVLDDHKRKCKEAEKPKKRKVAHFMKKVVKKFHSSASSSTALNKDAIVPVPIKKKLSKALKMFRRKVHPEEMTEKKFVKLKNGEKKDSFDEDAHQIGEDKDNKMVGQAATKDSAMNTIKLSSNGISECASTINSGHWIKTDADYLVLELQGWKH